MPQLEDALGCIYCGVHTVHSAGDHDIVIGSVESVRAGTKGTPLLFYRSEFRQVGSALEAPGRHA
jgi:3-hydroxy-9,10-secoandrosta-1,3,5(10)-triene-9,17-dione monooxygenase reductase component